MTKVRRRRGDALVVANLQTGASAAVLTASGDPDWLIAFAAGQALDLDQSATSIIEQLDKEARSTLVSPNADGSDFKLLSSSTPESDCARHHAQSGGDIIDWGPTIDDRC